MTLTYCSVDYVHKRSLFFIFSVNSDVVFISTIYCIIVLHIIDHYVVISECQHPVCTITAILFCQNKSARQVSPTTIYIMYLKASNGVKTVFEKKQNKKTKRDEAVDHKMDHL